MVIWISLSFTSRTSVIVLVDVVVVPSIVCWFLGPQHQHLFNKRNDNSQWKYVVPFVCIGISSWMRSQPIREDDGWPKYHGQVLSTSTNFTTQSDGNKNSQNDKIIRLVSLAYIPSCQSFFFVSSSWLYQQSVRSGRHSSLQSLHECYKLHTSLLVKLFSLSQEIAPLHPEIIVNKALVAKINLHELSGTDVIQTIRLHKFVFS